VTKKEEHPIGIQVDVCTKVKIRTIRTTVTVFHPLSEAWLVNLGQSGAASARLQPHLFITGTGRRGTAVPLHIVVPVPKSPDLGQVGWVVILMVMLDDALYILSRGYYWPNSCSFPLIPSSHAPFLFCSFDPHSNELLISRSLILIELPIFHNIHHFVDHLESNAIATVSIDARLPARYLDISIRLEQKDSIKSRHIFKPLTRAE